MSLAISSLISLIKLLRFRSLRLSLMMILETECRFYFEISLSNIFLKNSADCSLTYIEVLTNSGLLYTLSVLSFPTKALMLL